MADKLKEGVSIKELENFARKYTNEAFLIVALIIATLSSILDFFTGPVWTIGLAGVGAIVSLAFPDRVLKFEKKLFQFLSKQEKTTQLVIGIVRIVLSIFVPFVLFVELGLLSGIAFHLIPKHFLSQEKLETEKPLTSGETEEKQ